MASPITWQNVTGRSLAEASIPLEAASKTILGGFDRLSKAADGYGQLQQTIQNQEEEANVQYFMERLHRANTIGAVDELKASGELDTWRSVLKPTSLAKVRGAEDARIASLMQQTAARNTFEDSIADRAADPIRQAYRVAVLNRDEATQKAIRDANPNLRGLDRLLDEERKLERTFVEQDRADRLAPIQEANAIAEGKLKTVQLKTAERNNNEAEEAYRLETRLAAAKQDYLNQQTEREKALGNVAKKLNLPVDAAGFAKVDDLTTQQLAELNNEAILSGIASATEVRGSDTITADKFLAQLTKSGEFSDRTLNKFRDTIRNSFASNGLSPAIGNDAAAIALARAQEKVINDERAKNNWSAPGAPDTRRNYEELAKDVPSLIDKTSGIDPEEDVADIQNLLNELAVKGIEVKKGVFVTPSTNDVRAALRQAQGGWFKDNTRANNVKEYLKTIMSSPEVTKRLAESEDLKIYQRKQAVREILNK